MKRSLTVLMALLILATSTGYTNILNSEARKWYETGKELFNDKKYIEAIGEFQKVINKHPKSEWADDALFMIGKSNEEIGAYCVSEYQFRRYPKRYTKRYDMPKYKRYMRYIKEHRVDYRYFEPAGEYEYLGSVYKKLEQEYSESELADDAHYQIIRMKMVGDWEGGPGKLALALKLYEPFFKKYPKSKYIKEAIHRINHSFPRRHFYFEKDGYYKEPLKMGKEMLSKYREILRYVEKDNDISEALLAIGKEYYEMKDYQSAKAALSELKKMYPKDKRVDPVLEMIEGEIQRETLLRGKNRKEQIAILKELLADPDPQIQKYAIEKIGKMKESAFIPTLLEMYIDANKDKNWKLSQTIRRSLREIGVEGEEQFARLIKKAKDKTTKIGLARVCKNIKSEKINQASIELLRKEKEPEVKMAFLELLVYTIRGPNDPKALPIYLKFIDDNFQYPDSKETYYPIRNYAFEGILRLDKSIAIPELEKILRETEDSYNRKQAIDMLSRADAGDSIELIMGFRNDENLEIRRSVLLACERLQWQSKNEKIMRMVLPFLAEEDMELRLLAVRTLQCINNEKAIPYLVKMLNDREVIVRTSAAIVLYGLGYSKGIIAPLIEGLESGVHPYMLIFWGVNQIAPILGKLKAKEAVPVLIDKMWRDYTYSLPAIRALGEIGDSRALPELKKIAINDNIRQSIRDEAKKAIQMIQEAENK